jgi:hypothetical protein
MTPSLHWTTIDLRHDYQVAARRTYLFQMIEVTVQKPFLAHGLDHIYVVECAVLKDMKTGPLSDTGGPSIRVVHLLSSITGDRMS